MSFVGLGPEEETRMLKDIGVASFDELLGALPKKARLERPLAVPGPLSEIEQRRTFGAWAAENTAARAVSFMGAGAYDHFVPAAVNAIAMRSEFATAYTPYQPEVAQGSLTAIFEFQSMIAELTGMDVANASLYDGATAVVEAVLLARTQTGRSGVVVAGALHPHTIEVLRTYLDGQGLTVVADRGGVASVDDVRATLGPDVACVVYQYPNFFGLIESPAALHEAAHAAGALAIAACDPIALALLEPPGSSGADMAVGEGQPLGNYPSFGGPALGFFACRQSLVRRMPGRLTAETVDRDGKRGFVLTLQTREQHIRREKATSNICTNQGLLALRATVYMGLMGKEGLRDVATLCVQKTHWAAAEAAKLPGYRLAHAAKFFREFALECPVPARDVIAAGRAKGVLAGVDLGRFKKEWERWLLVTVTEQRSREEIERWLDALRAAAAPNAARASDGTKVAR
ncbi:MAG TPA: aminomethyl-transferring glycine dehydrogenase subunit GcvPA [Candidatus Saccharimonadaceae bacterium]|jgi:glycine dehydrogenase subunit 1|nr:aminomethyl-transferring glycine dehydrogenase subunit GcvPA [Candidatus Saccharimonadaceae bacterium]